MEFFKTWYAEQVIAANSVDGGNVPRAGSGLSGAARMPILPQLVVKAKR